MAVFGYYSDEVLFASVQEVKSTYIWSEIESFTKNEADLEMVPRFHLRPGQGPSLDLGGVPPHGQAENNHDPEACDDL